MAAKGIHKELDEFIRDIEERDLQDSTRAASPMRVAEGAEVLDTTGITAREAVDHVIKIVEEGV
jgi:CMP/dCMP kinase